MDGQPADESLPGLARVRARRRPAPAGRAPVPPAESDPVAQVLVAVPLVHLDRPFDYAVPATMADTAVPGARVRVRFAGQDVDGFVLARVPTSDHPGRLAPLRRVVSPEPVLLPEVAELTALVAERYAGARADVLRLAVPPRHARAEAAPAAAAGEAATDLAAARAAWSAYDAGPGLVDALARGGAPRAVWSALPGASAGDATQADWPDLLAHAVAATLESGRGALLCVPDGKDVARVGAALTRVLGKGQHVELTADRGPAARYADFLTVSRGLSRVVVGTRAAAFAPVRDLGLVAIWDDGDDLHAEPRAPYPHTREVLLTRAERQGTAALVGGFGRTVEAEYLLTTGWARELVPPRETLRDRVRVRVAGASDVALARDPLARTERLPREALAVLRAGLDRGPVLVQTPRAGYVPSLACERCRTAARCAACRGPLRLTSPTAPPSCAWCGRDDPAWACRTCGHRGLRAPVRGGQRTAEELGRTFPHTTIRSSGGDRVLTDVPDRPAIVVATPGAEPVAAGGYAAVLLLDTWLSLGRIDLRVAEESLRRWFNAAALVASGGEVLAVGDPGEPSLQALVRWDPAGFARRELADRRSAHLPPASRLATITGPVGAVDDALSLLALPPEAELLGPARVDDGPDGVVRALVRVPRARSAALSAALGELQRLRSARKLEPVRVQVDPIAL